MPAVSKSQQRLMAACEHGAKLDACPKSMTKEQMHDFAATPRKGLPEHAAKAAKKGMDQARKGHN